MLRIRRHSKLLRPIIACMIVAGPALVAYPASADEADFSDPISTEIQNASPPLASHQPDSSSLVIAGIQGQELGGVTVAKSKFALAIDDQVHLINRYGEPTTSFTNIPGATAPQAALTHVFVGSSTGTIHGINMDTELIDNTWSTGSSAIRCVEVSAGYVYFVTEANPTFLGRIHRTSGAVDTSFFESDGEIRFIGADSSHITIVTDKIETYKLPSFSAQWFTLRSTFPIASTVDLVLNRHGSVGWVAAAGSSKGFELDLFQGTERRQLEMQVEMAAVYHDADSSRVVFGTAADTVFDIRVYLKGADELSPIALINLPDGEQVAERGLALTKGSILAVVEDPTCGCLGVRMVYPRPILDTGEEPVLVEAGPATSLTLRGTSLATINRVAHGSDYVPLPFTVGDDGQTITIDLSAYTLGHLDIRLIGPAGSTDVDVYIVPPYDFTDTACPWITDSVSRLYSAYFLRSPLQDGFEYWLGEYSSGRWSLDRMSMFFSDSQEFDERYGERTDGQFVALVYQNVFGRQADESGRTYWLERIQNEGLTRGELMLLFSESPEYVAQTETQAPLAGYFNWYPTGTTWTCGINNVEYDIPQGTKFVDVAFWNLESSDRTITIHALWGEVWMRKHSASSPSNTVSAFLGVKWRASRTAISLKSSGDYAWTLVFSPTGIPTTRGGWE